MKLIFQKTGKNTNANSPKSIVVTCSVDPTTDVRWSASVMSNGVLVLSTATSVVWLCAELKLRKYLKYLTFLIFTITANASSHIAGSENTITTLRKHNQHNFNWLLHETLALFTHDGITLKRIK